MKVSTKKMHMSPSKWLLLALVAVMLLVSLAVAVRPTSAKALSYTWGDGLQAVNPQADVMATGGDQLYLNQSVPVKFPFSDYYHYAVNHSTQLNHGVKIFNPIKGFAYRQDFFWDGSMALTLAFSQSNVMDSALVGTPVVQLKTTFIGDNTTFMLDWMDASFTDVQKDFQTVGSQSMLQLQFKHTQLQFLVGDDEVGPTEVLAEYSAGSSEYDLFLSVFSGTISESMSGMNKIYTSRGGFMEVLTPSGSVSADFSFMGSYAGLAELPEQPAHSGTFEGWYFGKSLDSERYSFGKGIYAGQTVYPLFSTNTVELPPDPVKEGYTFTGWYLDKACTQPYEGQPITGDMSLYAGWQINTFTVTFDSAGGSAVATQTLNWNTAATLTTPTRDGHTFLGWFIGDAQYINAPIKANTMLTAKWQIHTFIVTFDSAEGSAVAAQTVDWNTVPTISTPTRDGHTFLGWFIGDAQYTNAPIKADTTLTATWQIHTFTVTFDSAGGSAVATQTINWNTAATLSTPTRDGHTFLGWFIGDTQYTNAPIKADTTLTAKWQIHTFKVTFDSAGGSAVATQTVDWNTAATLTTPTRAGHDFLGWFLADGAEYTAGQPIKADTLLTAHWQIQKFNVSFVVDDEIYAEMTVDYGSILVKK